MNFIRKNILKRSIADVLENCEPYMVLEPNLRNEVNMTCRPPCSQEEFDEVIELMSKAKQITRLNTEDGFKTKLTDEGRAEILRKG